MRKMCKTQTHKLRTTNTSILTIRTHTQHKKYKKKEQKRQKVKEKDKDGMKNNWRGMKGTV